MATNFHINFSGVFCMVMTCTLVNFSPWLGIYDWLELKDKHMVSYIP